MRSHVDLPGYRAWVGYCYAGPLNHAVSRPCDLVRIRGQTGEFPISRSKIPHGNREFTRLAPNLSREGIGPNLEVRDLSPRAFAAFDVPDEMGAVVGPESAAFPSGVGIVDTPIHPARIESERVGHTQLDPFFGLRV